MGLSIFYSLSAPANIPEEDVLNRINLLRTKAAATVKKDFPKFTVGKIYTLDVDEVVVAQADPDCEPFPFALQATRPIGARGCKPILSIGFNVAFGPHWEAWLGLCRYPAETQILTEWTDTEAANYGGKWFFYNYVDSMGVEPRRLIRSLLETAKSNGFSVQVKDETGETF